MGLGDISTEQTILKAAEEEFIDKGFDRTKITEIAKRAGVNHAMLHYYFRTKENLFNMVFEQKVKEIGESLSAIFEQDLPFFEKLKLGIERHFDTIAANPKLPFFVYSEIIVNEERRGTLMKVLLPKAQNIVTKLEEAISNETEKGSIAPINAIDLIFSIVSLNVCSFLSLPIFNMLADNPHEYQHYLQHRKEYNAWFILKGLRLEVSNK